MAVRNQQQTTMAKQEFKWTFNDCDEYRIEWELGENQLHIDYNVYLDKESEHFMQAFIKWDGCINLSFPSMNDCMFHGCCPSHLDVLSLLPKELYKHAKINMPQYEGE
jgi:hypothetical protein